MASRAADWFRQAEADLAAARHAGAGGHHEWACFAAQQAAGKAVKAVHLRKGQEPWGHSVTALLQALAAGGVPAEASLLDRARALDKAYIAARYPNGLPSGAPADFFTLAEGQRATGDAEAILELCRSLF